MKRSISKRPLILAVVLAAFVLTGFVFASIQKTDSELKNLSLVSQSGKVFTLGDLNGKPVILNFVFTGCSVYCPVQVGTLSALQMQSGL